MQIHEVTLPTDVAGKLAKGAIQGIKNVGSAVGSRAGQAAGAIKGGATYAQQAPGKIRQSYRQAKTARQAAGVAGKAQVAWETYVQNLQATQQATPQVLETALRAFIQKNLLGDLRYQYNTLTNVDQIENVITQIINPANAQRQSELWTQLVKTVGVSQAGGQAPGGAVPGPGGKKPKQKPGGSPGANPADIKKGIIGSGIPEVNFDNMGSILKQYSGTGSVGSTGNPVIDAFLQSLKFNVQ